MTIPHETIQEVRQHARGLLRELEVLKGVFQDTGLSYSQCHVLFELDQQKVLNVMELADQINLDKSTASRVVKHLEKEAFVEVSPSPSDKREKRFSLSEAGKKQIDINNELANKQVAEALQLLLPEEQQTVLKGLALYTRALRQSRQQEAYSFRLIEPKDNPQVARLIREVMTEYGTVGEGYSILDPEVDCMYETYTTNKSAFWVIEQNGTIHGCGGIGPLEGGSKDICELKKMYFYPSLRGLGFGKKLVRVALEKAKELGYAKCYLETVERMWQANLLYQKLGFEKLETPMGNTGHSGCEAYYSINLT